VSAPAAALGKFDALHLGHRALAARAAELAGAACLVSFAGMAAVLGWAPRLPLVAPGDRARVLAAWSAELCAPLGALELDFAAVRALAAGDFLELLRDRHGIATVVVGEDFRGGRDRSASAADLHELAQARGMRVAVVPAVAVAGEPVSSSRVREDLGAGRVREAAACLGRPHRLLGVVERGDARGRAIGFPTANCASLENQEPGVGVYAAWARLDAGGDPIPAAVNVGHAPSLHADRRLIVEAHLIGWSGDCYGRRLALDFVARLRDEARFGSLEALTAQLARDVADARAALGAA
jgi:riboflavin kinase/FMN adenylyltransferase